MFRADPNNIRQIQLLLGHKISAQRLLERCNEPANRVTADIDAPIVASEIDGIVACNRRGSRASDMS